MTLLSSLRKSNVKLLEGKAIMDIFHPHFLKTLILFLTFFLEHALAVSHTYELRKTDNHVIHIITLSPESYEIEFVKAHNQVFGRETVPSMALRQNGDIAINGGFFEIGHNKDGMPSRTLIIDGNIFGFKSKKQDCLVQKTTGLSIEPFGNATHLKLGEKSLTITKVNQFAENKDVILYTNTWGPNTLTPFKGRHEIVCDKNHKIIAQHDHGNSVIPPKGFVLSFPDSHKLDSSLLKNSISPYFKDMPLKEKISAVSGIPQLVKEGNIIEDVLKNTNHFYTMPHARTAIGLKKNGDVVIVVAEHAYKRDLKKITLGEVKNLIQNNKIKMVAQYKKMPHNLTLEELKTIVQHEFSDANGAIGLTLPKLSDLMIQLECDSALNLDGGGSSTLWIDGQVINHPIGDEDEDMGQSHVRPVSDGIIFKKKDK